MEEIKQSKLLETILKLTLQLVLLTKIQPLTLYSLNSPWTEFRSTGFQCMFALVLSTFDTRRSVGESVGSEHMKKNTLCVNSWKGPVLFVQE